MFTFDKTLERLGGAVLCPDEYGTLIVLVTHDLTGGGTRGEMGSSNASCVVPALEDDCRWRREPCRSGPISEVLVHLFLFGVPLVVATEVVFGGRWFIGRKSR
jgi:hypothetical protein